MVKLKNSLFLEEEAIDSNHWEIQLLSLALPKTSSKELNWKKFSEQEDFETLSKAYKFCEALTAKHSSSFSLASSLLPKKKRLAARAVYSFCRFTDDIVDIPLQNPHEKLEEWRNKILNPEIQTTDPIILAWRDACYQYQIPPLYAEQLINGIGRDLRQNRYQSFQELTSYCYGVASTVGLMSMHIIGFTNKKAFPYAIKLGVALQLTNILRDIAEDFQLGFIYLPQDELVAFNIIPEDFANQKVTSNWRNFLRFQIERNKKLYEEAWPGIGMLHPDGRFSIAAAAEFYRGILHDIERHDYDVFSRRAFVSKKQKLFQLPRIWWRSRNATKLASQTPSPLSLEILNSNENI